MNNMRSRLSLVIARLLYAECAENRGGDGYQHFHYHFPSVCVQFTHNLMSCLSMVISVLSVYTVSSVPASLSML